MGDFNIMMGVRQLDVP